MFEEKIEVCKALLSEYFECETTQLDKTFEVLRAADRIFGEKVFKNAVKEIISDEPSIEPPAFGAYFCVVNSVIKELTTARLGKWNEFGIKSWKDLINYSFNIK